MIAAGILAGKSVAAKNALATLMAGAVMCAAAIPFDFSAWGIPGMVLGAFGGSSRWIALRQKPRDGAVSVIVGAMMGWTFDGSTLIPLEEWLRMDADDAQRATSVIIGVIAVVAIGSVADLGGVRRVFSTIYDFMKGKASP